LLKSTRYSNDSEPAPWLIPGPTRIRNRAAGRLARRLMEPASPHLAADRFCSCGAPAALVVMGEPVCQSDPGAALILALEIRANRRGSSSDDPPEAA
jgi:hypothetical protein